MSEHPIVFSRPMLCAILAGRKTQTRRIVRTHGGLPCPYGVPGDTLWVREAHRIWWDGHSVGGVVVEYRADGVQRPVAGYRAHHGTVRVDGGVLADETQSNTHWRPPIYMPHAACRLVLVLESLRVERLQAISEEDAIAEGHENRAAFAVGWDVLNGKRAPWSDNPWVWVLGFRRAG